MIPSVTEPTVIHVADEEAIVTPSLSNEAESNFDEETTGDGDEWESIEEDLFPSESSDEVSVNLDAEFMKIALLKIFFVSMERRRLQDQEKLAEGEVDVSKENITSNADGKVSIPNSSDKSTGSSSSGSHRADHDSSTARSHSELEPMCLSFDGDFPQIEASFVAGLEVARELKIDLQKFPGGTSLMYQPNDVMRSHSMIHRYVQSERFSSFCEHEMCDPKWLPDVEEMIQPIDKASRDSFLNFFRQLPEILDHAFQLKIIKSGWRSSGLMPLDHEAMLKKCAKWDKLHLHERDTILKAIPHIVREARLQGFVSDATMKELIPDINLTDVTNMDGRPINQQRALWLNGEGVLEMRRLQEAHRKQQATSTAEKQRSKRIQKSTKALASAVQMIKCAFSKSDGYIRCEGNRCKEIRRYVSKQGHDDGWRGCPIANCKRFFCGKASCQSQLRSHFDTCFFHKTQRDILEKCFELSRNGD